VISQEKLRLGLGIFEYNTDKVNIDAKGNPIKSFEPDA
jgi:hypothetical protein